MHRNTYILVIFLAIFAALVAGVNIGHNMKEPQQELAGYPSERTTITQPAPIEPVKKDYENKGCAVTFPIPNQFTLTNESTLSAMFTRSDAKSSILLACQKDIPRPPLPTSYIETVKLTTVDKTTTISAKLYHDQSQKDGEKIDALIYYNPNIKMDVFIAGYGPEFDTLRSTLHLLQ